MMIHRLAKPKGDISSLFPSLSGNLPPPLPSRFADVKRRLLRDTTPEVLQRSWDRLLVDLEKEIRIIEKKGSSVVPEIDFRDLDDLQKARNSGSEDGILQEIRKRGVLVVKGIIPQEEALELKSKTLEYISANKEKVRAFPASSPSVYEIYWSPSQIRARTHPGMYSTHKFLLSLWDSKSTAQPLSYADRLRIRPPGDSNFTLGPHVDSGSVERWEDPTYASVYQDIWSGNWESYDPYGHVDSRETAHMDLYNAPGGCSMLRMWQGWLALSNTGPGEGTLRTFPLVKHATAYFLLRPFFEQDQQSGKWILKQPPTSTLPLSYLGAAQELNSENHPHLSLDTAMISVPRVAPGDYVAWHCDLIHSVEAHHLGKGDSSVFYIPVVPHNAKNLEYLKTQKSAMESGAVPTDFPGSGSAEEGSGEVGWLGRGSWEDVHPGVNLEAKKSLGWEL
ncbi:hypothetical protein DFH27DRAFT_590185 [Peziza echinospora]|nr:hypothetical protein DFH27DRAFT_590185 [Peziza echinospora]